MIPLFFQNGTQGQLSRVGDIRYGISLRSQPPSFIRSSLAQYELLARTEKHAYQTNNTHTGAYIRTALHRHLIFRTR